MSTPINDGGPAFPMGIPASSPQHGAYSQKGMTLRDYFAAAALQGFLASETAKIETLAELTGPIGISTAEISAETAYIYADAMLTARNPESPTQ